MRSRTHSRAISATGPATWRRTCSSICGRNMVRIFTARKRSLGQGNIFTPVCHSVHRGVCVVAPGGRAWLLQGRAWFYSGGAWFYSGGVRGFIRGCMVLFGGHAWFYSGGRVWFFQFFWIQWDTVNERAVRILLECILVWNKFILKFCFKNENASKIRHWKISQFSQVIWYSSVDIAEQISELKPHWTDI